MVNRIAVLLCLVGAAGVAQAEDSEAFRKAHERAVAFLQQKHRLPETAYGYMSYASRKKGIKMTMTLSQTEPDQQGKRYEMMRGSISLKGLTTPGARSKNAYSQFTQQMVYDRGLGLVWLKHDQTMSGGGFFVKTKVRIKLVNGRLRLDFQQEVMGQPEYKRQIVQQGPARFFYSLGYVFAIYCRKAPKNQELAVRMFTERANLRHFFFKRTGQDRITHAGKEVKVTVVKRYREGEEARATEFLISEEGVVLQLRSKTTGTFLLIKHIYRMSGEERSRRENDRQK